MRQWLFAAFKISKPNSSPCPGCMAEGPLLHWNPPVLTRTDERTSIPYYFLHPCMLRVCSAMGWKSTNNGHKKHVQQRRRGFAIGSRSATKFWRLGLRPIKTSLTANLGLKRLRGRAGCTLRLQYLLCEQGWSVKVQTRTHTHTHTRTHACMRRAKPRERARRAGIVRSGR